MIERNYFFAKYMLFMTLEPKYLSKLYDKLKNFGFDPDKTKEFKSLVHEWGKLNKKRQEGLLNSFAEELGDIFESKKFRECLPKYFKNKDTKELIKELLTHDLWNISRAFEKSGDKNFQKILENLRRGRPNEASESILRFSKKVPILFALLKYFEHKS